MPQLQKPARPQNLRSTTREATKMRSPGTTTREWFLLTVTRVKPTQDNEDPAQTKINELKINKSKKKIYFLPIKK